MRLLEKAPRCILRRADNRGAEFLKPSRRDARRRAGDGDRGDRMPVPVEQRCGDAMDAVEVFAPVERVAAIVESDAMGKSEVLKRK
jgi:hypothetical protein